MHEWSLAGGIVQSVEDECRRRSADRVSSITVSVGELAQIEVPLLREALRELKKGSVMAGCRVLIRQERTGFRCRRCGNGWTFAESRGKLKPLEKGGDNAVHYIPSSINAFTGCPSCGSPDFEITSGFGLQITGIRTVGSV